MSLRNDVLKVVIFLIAVYALMASCFYLAFGAEPPPLPKVQEFIGPVSTNTIPCPPVVFIFTNLTGKTSMETSTNLTHWRKILWWPSNEYIEISIEIAHPTNKAVYWRLQ